MNYSYLPAAVSELTDSAQYYDSESAGLGLEFLDEIEHSVRQITAFPEAWTEVRPGVRRYLTRRFPFALLYSKQRNHIVILAVMHCKKKPDYWVDRI